MKKLIIFCISFLTISVAFGQGFESFENFAETGSSYKDGTFVGQDGSTWTYTQCRGDYEITGKSIIIGRNRDPQSNFYSGTISNGVGTLSFDYMQAFSTNVNLNVMINDVVVGNVTSNGEQEVIKNSGDIEVNVAGDFVIKFINANNGDGQVVVDNLEWTAFNSNIVATPTFTPPAGQYFEEINVEIACSTPDASIYYTLDGSDPDETSTPYTTPIAISTNTTVKARAYAAGIDPSSVAQADYTFSQSTTVADLTELRDSFTGGQEVFVVTGEVILTFQQDFRGQKYIEDDYAAILIDDDAGVITTQYAIGDGITGISGTLAEYGNMLQFVPVSDPGAPTSTGNQITPVELTVSEMVSGFEDYEARLVKISNVSFADAGSAFVNGSVYQISDDSKAEGSFRTTFYDVDYIGSMIPAGPGEIIGILNSRTEGNYITSRSQADMIWGVIGEPENYPTDFTAYGQELAIQLSWTDATGEVAPQGYLIMLNTQESEIAIPQDGMPVADDTDLSDGSGAMNVMQGEETYTFSNLSANTTYYSIIFPYTNSGSLIDYKNDGPPFPTGSATTEDAGIPENLPSVNLSIWPNPGNGVFYFTAEKPLQSIEVFNVTGMKVYNYTGSESQGQIDLSELGKGIYVARITTADDEILSRRIVIR